MNNTKITTVPHNLCYAGLPGCFIVGYLREKSGRLSSQSLLTLAMSFVAFLCFYVEYRLGTGTSVTITANSVTLNF